jgi:MFS family permease
LSIGTPADRRAAWALAIVGLGASVGPLDFAVNVAFPAMTQAFDLQTRDIRWVAVCYVLTYGSLMLVCGALGDRFGHLKMFRAGLALGVLAFASCASAPTYPWLLAARVLQGVSVALTLSCAPALAMALYPEGQRTRALRPTRASPHWRVRWRRCSAASA